MSRRREDSMPETRYRICPLCEATCGLELTVDHGVVTAVHGDDSDVFSHGFVCPKGAALTQLHDDPDRLRTPLLRRDGELRAATWDEAFDEIEKRLPPLLAEHGTDALAVYLGNPNVHNLALALYGQVLLRTIRTNNIYSASTVDQMPKQLAAGLMFGTFTSVAVPDIEGCDFLLVLGANPFDSNGSLWTVPDFPGRLRALQKRGGTCIVVDPRRTRTAVAADRHLFIRPGTDAHFLMGLVHTLFAEKLVQLGRLAEHVNGVEQIEAAVRTFAPSVVAAVCGIEAGVIRDVAQQLARAQRGA
ncbi:MAG: molybdopterin-dependent oxidoreductase, partial [Deltaproteobacteria bacterium]|nr:molybdopterin-dependent oxidoreductase [Deltaproteobacteria bacterium]